MSEMGDKVVELARARGVVADSLAYILGAGERYLRRYIFMDDHQAAALTLWVAHTHAFEAAETTLYVEVTSAEEECGKSRVFEAAELIVRSPLMVVNPSPSSVFRMLDKEQATLLLDEIDNMFGGDRAFVNELIGILNAGYRRGAVVPRQVGQKGETTKLFNVFSPKAFAGIGSRLPRTTQSRCVTIRLKKKKPGEEAENFRRREALVEAEPVKGALEAWATDSVIESLAASRPEMPKELSDRQMDAWEPLFAIADLAGGEWPDRARVAAKALHGRGVEERASTKLLGALRNILDSKEAAFSGDLVDELNAIEEEPWGGWNEGRGINSRDLARNLKLYDIRPEQIRIGDVTRKGYKTEWFSDAWERYLSPSPPFDPDLNETSETSQVRADIRPKHSEASVSLEKQASTRDVSLVSDKSAKSLGGAAPRTLLTRENAETEAQTEEAARETLADFDREWNDSEPRNEHPACFSPEIIAALTPILSELDLPVHDPLAGTGERLGRLCDELGLDFTGTEIEEEFIVDERVSVGDSTQRDSYPRAVAGMPDVDPRNPGFVVVTSPTYGNGMNDSFEAKDDSKRHTYRAALGRPLHANNTGGYGIRRGESAMNTYWDLHRQAVRWWPDRAVVNVSDFIHSGAPFPLVDGWKRLLGEHGYAITDEIKVATKRQGFGANREARVETESILICQRRSE